ncbi:MAG: hypothetical protein PHW63_04960 [Alphaproteobacteria bacterium]|nr:hypothetical protein [Alphaproteobacteria bacterium]
MLKVTTEIAPTKALYIKLGRSGNWEKECLEKGILRLDYDGTPFDAAASGDWDTVHKFWLEARKDSGTATRDVNQIRNYFESGEDTLWITFHDSKLWWCFAKMGVKKHSDGHGSYRETLDGWHDADVNGGKLSSEKLSGSLLKVQSFQGTICDVKEFEYLCRKLNGLLLPEVDAAVKAENEMVQKIIPLMRLLTWQDFELLVDLIFSDSGWRRVGQVGKTQKTVDIELLLPTTGERAFVQIKSSAGKRDLADYMVRLQNSTIYDRMFFVWHSGEVGTTEADDVVLIGPDRLARMVFDAGLTTWLREKVS